MFLCGILSSADCLWKPHLLFAVWSAYTEIWSPKLRGKWREKRSKSTPHINKSEKVRCLATERKTQTIFTPRAWSKGVLFGGWARVPYTCGFRPARRRPHHQQKIVRRAQSDLFCRPERTKHLSLSRSECRCLRLRPGNLIRRTPDGEHADPFLLLFSAAAAGTLPTSKCAPAHATHSVSASECSQDVTFRLDPSSFVRSVPLTHPRIPGRPLNAHRTRRFWPLILLFERRWLRGQLTVF